MPIFRGKNFVSAVSDFKDSVRVASRLNVELTNIATIIDGVALQDKDRVLLLGQSNKVQNGIYSWSSSTGRFTRATDADSVFELSPGVKVYVDEGITFAETTWVLTTPGIITPGVTELTFKKENRISDTDLSGTYGGAGKTLQITVDETGEINSITTVDIEIDGGEF